MPKVYLRKTHPGLFKGVLSVALTHLLLSSLLLYGTLAAHRNNVNLSLLFIGAFMVISGTILYGLFAPHYRWVRIGLMLGFVFILFLSVSFLLAIGANLGRSEVIRYSWLIAPWPLFAYLQLIQLEEPPENPMSETNDG